MGLSRDVYRRTIIIPTDDDDDNNNNVNNNVMDSYSAGNGPGDGVTFTLKRTNSDCYYIIRRKISTTRRHISL